MNTSLWGPPAWRVLHGLAAAAPDDVPTWRRVVVALPDMPGSPAYEPGAASPPYVPGSPAYVPGSPTYD
jgi:hypothetical protein